MKVSAREKKFLLAALVAIVAYVLIQFVPLSGGVALDSGNERLSRAQRALRREKELIADGQLPSRVSALQADLGKQQKQFLSGTDVSQAGAQFQSWLAQRAADQQLEVLRTDFLPSAPVAPGWVRVPVRIELHGRISQIVAFLTSVTQGDKLASVDEAQFSSYATVKEKQLLCVVVISGLMAKPALRGD